MPTQTLEELSQQIFTRLDAIGATILNEERIKALIKAELDLLVKHESFTRKMRFGGGQDRKLVGTKYARWNLSIADVEWLYDVQMSLRGQAKRGGGVHEGPSEELRNTFAAISQAYYVPEDEVRKIDQRAIDDLFPRIPLAWFQGKDRELAGQGAFELTEAYGRAIRAAMDTAESGAGSQLVGAQYVADLWQAARAESRIQALIDTFEMTAPTAYLPVEVDIPEMLFVSENTADNSAEYAAVNTGSQRVQVDAKKFVIHQIWSQEMEEDSILPFVPFLRRQATLALAHYGDAVLINGDTVTAGTGNINSDDAAPAATKHYLAFDGIRKAGLVNNTANSKDLAGPITLNALRDAKGRLIDATRFVDWGHPTDLTDLVYAGDPETVDRISLLDEVVKAKQMQNNRPLLNGEATSVLGHPVISTLTQTRYDVDGKYTTTTPATNDTKGEVTTFNRRGFKAGWRRRVMIETQRIQGRDQNRIMYSLRLGFGRFTPTGAASGIEAADVIYDVTL